MVITTLMDKIWSPIRFCINWILEGVRLGKIVAIITAIGVFLGPYLAERARRKHRKQEEHFIEIKEKVFKPLLTRLMNYHLPIIERKKTDIQVLAIRRVKETKSIAKCDTTISSGFEILRGEDNIDKILYEDVKQNHFKELCGRLESFEERVMGYSKNCLQIISDLKDKIIKNTKLKDYSEKEQSYMHAGDLAIYLFEKNFLKGREGSYLEITDDYKGKTIEDSNRRRKYACGQSKEIEECYAYLKKLFDEGIETKKLLEHLRGLKEELDRIMNEIRELILSKRIPGNCKLIY